jgi:cytochrome c553
MAFRLMWHGLALCAGALAMQQVGAETSVQGDAAKGEAIVAKICVGCHGADGNSVVPLFPKLAGQWPEYTLKQLQDFKKKKRTADTMAPIVADLSTDDFPHLAVYFGSKKRAPGAVKEPALLEAGKKMYVDGNPGTGVPSCAGCHGMDGKGTDRFPALAGQFQEYSLSQLKAFAKGDRKNDKKVMQAVADRLSEEEMKAVVEYIASMP